MNQAIHESVGRYGNNHRHDVTSIQLLLNNARYGEDPELHIDGLCGPRTIAAIEAYQRGHLRMTHPDGIVHPGCATIRNLLELSGVKNRSLIKEVHRIQKVQSPRSYPTANVDDLAPLPTKLHEALKTPEAHAASSGQTGHKYTDSPLEVPRTSTAFDPLTLPDMLQKAWPELNKEGARVLTAQSMSETRKAKACWNNNLGNLKCSDMQSATHLHQYLPGTWEYWDAAVVRQNLKINKNSRYATAEEIRRDVSAESNGRRVIVFVPPDRQCRFMAYKTLIESIVDWRDYFKRKTVHHSDFTDKLNKGDCVGVARILKQIGYYSQSETLYAKGMEKNKLYLDEVLK